MNSDRNLTDRDKKKAIRINSELRIVLPTQKIETRTRIYEDGTKEIIETQIADPYN